MYSNLQGSGRLQEPFFFISDVHISTVMDAKEEERRQTLFQLFDSIEQRGGTLFILGDFFDFWFEYPGYIHPALKEVVTRLLQVRDRGVEIHYIGGNHDFWVRDLILREEAMYFYPDHIAFTAGKDAADGGIRFYLCHGDGLLKNDHGYRLMKKVLRNPLAIFGFRLLGPSWGYRLGEKANNRSRHNYTVMLPYLQRDADEMMVWQAGRLSEGYDICIMGHIHYPELRQEASKSRVLLGDWVVPNHRYYALWDSDGIQRIQI